MKSEEMRLRVSALPINESFTRSTVAAFCARLNPTIEEIGDIKTAVSEAVTNCIVHAYEYQGGFIDISVSLKGNEILITITDNGKGISDISGAMQPFYTTKPHEERSGMGFTVMEAFTDELKVISEVNKGTTIILKKLLKTDKASITDA